MARRRQRPLSRFFRWMQRVFFAAGLAGVGLYLYSVVDSRWFQAHEEAAFEAALEEPAPPAPAIEPAKPPSPRRPAPRETIGRIRIPRIGIGAMIRCGVDSKTLRRAVGHVPGTALPGQPGNVGLAAHRDSFFRNLSGVKQNDRILIESVSGEFEYRVLSTKVVRPKNVEVLNATVRPSLTLITCYPFNYVGNAPKRFIVRAEQVAFIPRQPPGS